MAVKAGNEIFSQMKIRREATEISFYKKDVANIMDESCEQ